MFKKEKINQLILDSTVYNEGRFIRYLEYDNITWLFEHIKKTKETTNWLKVTLYYRNTKLVDQIKFLDHGLYIECRRRFNDKDLKEHWLRQLNITIDMNQSLLTIDDLSKETIEKAQVLYPLCKRNKRKQFYSYLDGYEAYLKQMIPKILEDLVDEYQLSEDDIAFGYFCYEIESR